ncbi:MerR family transcriptional regulator [bacterium]|nr:MerR family transcriptional regulator [bacterium]
MCSRGHSVNGLRLHPNRMEYTVSKLARMYGLSRSTLLYYDSIGLLKPAHRTEAHYRIYTESDMNRLEQIRTLRNAGVPLSEIKIMLEDPASRSGRILVQRLKAIQQQMKILRQQQRLIVHLLDKPQLLKKLPLLSKKKWILILRASGLDDKGMELWHREFEKTAPAAHQDFLESLGLSPEEIREIRQQH